jgi:hypothetical protein
MKVLRDIWDTTLPNSAFHVLLYSAPIRNNFEIFNYRNYNLYFFIRIGVLCGMHKEVKKPKIMKAPTALAQNVKQSLNL